MDGTRPSEDELARSRMCAPGVKGSQARVWNNRAPSRLATDLVGDLHHNLPEHVVRFEIFVGFDNLVEREDMFADDSLERSILEAAMNELRRRLQQLAVVCGLEDAISIDCRVIRQDFEYRAFRRLGFERSVDDNGTLLGRDLDQL